jgi:hypothetical protein
VAPALEVAAVGLLLAFLPTLALSLRGAAVAVTVAENDPDITDAAPDFSSRRDDQRRTDDR